MSILEKIAYHRNRRDEVPNQELAAELARTKNQADIAEVAGNLQHANKNIQADCLKVLYEIGYLEAGLISDYTMDFIQLLDSRNNRLVWGAMIALAAIAKVKPGAVGPHYKKIMACAEQGSVITVDNAVAVLSALAATGVDHRKEIFDYLIEHLADCRSKDVPQHAEKIVAAVTPQNRRRFIETISKRMPEMTPSRAGRLNKVLRAADSR